jgi:BASS family bile acid:Na+ symporter
MNLLDLISLLTVTALAAMMLSMGLRVTFETALASVRSVRLVALGLTANYLFVPVVTVALLYVFQTLPLVSAGFLILAVCPGAPIGPPAAALAKGNVPWAIGMMVILAGLSALLSPALLSVLLPRLLPESDLRFSYLAIIRTLLVAQMLPLVVGLTMHHFVPLLAHRLARPLAAAANLMLLILIGLLLVTEYGTLSVIKLRGWNGMILLFVSSLAIGWLCGGSDAATRRASALVAAARNAAVALVITTGNFADTPAVTAVVSYGLVSILGTFACGMLLGKYHSNETAGA